MLLQMQLLFLLRITLIIYLIYLALDTHNKFYFFSAKLKKRWSNPCTVVIGKLNPLTS
jgi:hypothetical protein